MPDVISALKKTVTKADGGLYTDAIHKITEVNVRVIGTETRLIVRVSMFKDQATADDPEGVAADKSVHVIDPASDPDIATAFAALQDIFYEQVKALVPELADAEDVTTP